uniref:DDE Tnp4 domain-containing protein n=1 Tax=Cyprinus carpio carpio TaxID=630221 RepID=A0A9J8D3C2_CYPCA
KGKDKGDDIQHFNGGRGGRPCQGVWNGTDQTCQKTNYFLGYLKRTSQQHWESFSSLSYQFRVGVSTIRQFIPETCSANYQVLKDKYLKGPDSVEQWQQVAHGFETQWNFPNCLGALDGKHSTFYNYKHSFSIVLMALVDSSYRFLYVDVGFNGQISDGGVFEGCSLQNALENRTVNIPASAPLPGSNQLTPYCIVADEAFPLKEYLMKPYPNRRLSVQQHIFNYRLSRARRVVENAFGILANRF